MKVCYDGIRGEYYESSDSLLDVTNKYDRVYQVYNILAYILNSSYYVETIFLFAINIF